MWITCIQTGRAKHQVHGGGNACQSMQPRLVRYRHSIYCSRMQHAIKQSTTAKRLEKLVNRPVNITEMPQVKVWELERKPPFSQRTSQWSGNRPLPEPMMTEIH